MGTFRWGGRYARLDVMVGTMLGAIWTVVTLPFRLVLGAVELLGRLTGLVLGFALMVVGVALSASPFYIVGIPVFLVGLVLTLRSIG